MRGFNYEYNHVYIRFVYAYRYFLIYIDSSTLVIVYPDFEALHIIFKSISMLFVDSNHKRKLNPSQSKILLIKNLCYRNTNEVFLQ